MTDSSFEARLQRIVRQVLDTRVDLLAIMMAEAGVDAATAKRRLTVLVHGLRSPRIESTIFEDGRRLATAVEGEEIVLNRELLQRVGDAEVLTALARPVAQITELASVGVSLAFQIDDDQMMRDLAMKAQRRTENEVVRASSIPDWVQYRIETLTERLGRLCGGLGRASVFETTGADELRRHVEGAAVWPEWADIDAIEWCKNAVAAVHEAMEGTFYEQHAETLTELMWDSLVLSTQSFVRHAGRTLRSLGNEIQLDDLLVALARAASGDEAFSTDVADWPAYLDVFEAWRDLNRHESAMFGPVLLNDRTPPASVVVPAQQAFGLDEPKELPWDAPLVCWTTREHRALRDLLIGFIKTLPGHTEQALEAHTLVEVGDEPPLDLSGERQMLSIQVVALGTDSGFIPPSEPERPWSACVRRIVDQFESSDEYTREAVLASLRLAYDELFPESQPIWARRLFDVDELSQRDKLVRLVTTVNNVFHAPLFFDPFRDPDTDEIAPMATIVLPVGITTAGRVPFFVPMVALTSTLNGAPLRVRVVEVPPQSDAPCRWLCDRGLHLTKLAQQPVELIARAVRGDALQMAIS